MLAGKSRVRCRLTRLAGTGGPPGSPFRKDPRREGQAALRPLPDADSTQGRPGDLLLPRLRGRRHWLVRRADSLAQVPGPQHPRRRGGSTRGRRVGKNCQGRIGGRGLPSVGATERVVWRWRKALGVGRTEPVGRRRLVSAAASKARGGDAGRTEEASPDSPAAEPGEILEDGVPRSMLDAEGGCAFFLRKTS